MSGSSKLIVTVFIIVVLIFVPPFLMMIAWNGFANGFNLPTFSYWHWFITHLALRLVTGRVDFERIGES